MILVIFNQFPGILALTIHRQGSTTRAETHAKADQRKRSNKTTVNYTKITDLIPADLFCVISVFNLEINSLTCFCACTCFGSKSTMTPCIQPGIFHFVPQRPDGGSDTDGLVESELDQSTTLLWQRYKDGNLKLSLSVGQHIASNTARFNNRRPNQGSREICGFPIGILSQCQSPLVRVLDMSFEASIVHQA